MSLLQEQLEVRDRFLRKPAARRSVEELMRDMWQLRQASWEQLQRVSQAWELYKRAQFKKRAIDVRPDYFE